MTNSKSSVVTPFGILLALVVAAFLFLLQGPVIQGTVYSTYINFIVPHQLYSVAWVLATMDHLLNLTTPFPLLFWGILVFVTSLILRNVKIAIKMMLSTLILPLGTWLLFSIKYAVIIPLSFNFFLSFLWGRLFPSLVFVLVLTALVSLPFWIWARKQREPEVPRKSMAFGCSRCGAEYRSKPLVCIHCGAEYTINS